MASVMRTMKLIATRIAVLYSLEPLKASCLVALTLNTTVLDILASYSLRPIPGAPRYSPAAAVLLAELGKIVVSSLLYLHESHTKLDITIEGKKSLRETYCNGDIWLMSVPASIYVLQNALRYVALTELDVATFQITSQLKIFTTALCTILIMKRYISSRQWLCLVSLVFGTLVVQAAAHGRDATGNAVTSATVMTAPGGPTKFIAAGPTYGFIANLAASLLSGLAGVFMEKVIKTTSASLWARQMQLSIFSVVPASLLYLASAEWTFRTLFRGFDQWTCLVIIFQIYVGLIAALVIKHADNILKILASSVSMILTAVVAIPVFGERPTANLLVGSAIVIASTYGYGTAAKPRPTLAGESSLSSAVSTPRQDDLERNAFESREKSRWQYSPLLTGRSSESSSDDGHL